MRIYAAQNTFQEFIGMRVGHLETFPIFHDLRHVALQ